MYSLNLESKLETKTKHVPILVNEVLETLDCRPGKNFLDLTLGGGGHTESILKATAPDGRVVGCDRDEEALARTRIKLADYGERVRFVHRAISDVEQTLPQFANMEIHGALIDAGISSDQLDSSSRGFSFQRDADLDMRMDVSRGMTAREVLMNSNEEEIANMIYEYGEDRNSRKIAKMIMEARRQDKLRTTQDLVEAVIKANGPKRGPIHPATKTFQALRIRVNRELEELTEGVTKLIALLPAFARIAVITFHSLEDRIVKNLFRDAVKRGDAVRITKKPIVPTREEQRANARSRSAKLRVIEIVGVRGE